MTSNKTPAYFIGYSFMGAHYAFVGHIIEKFNYQAKLKKNWSILVTSRTKLKCPNKTLHHHWYVPTHLGKQPYTIAAVCLEKYHHYGLLFILTSIWVLRTPNTGRNSIFHIINVVKYLR